MDETRLIAIKIAGAGYAGGDPRAVHRWPVDLVFDTLHFLRFQSEYMETQMVMNSRTK